MERRGLERLCALLIKAGSAEALDLPSFKGSIDRSYSVLVRARERERFLFVERPDPVALFALFMANGESLGGAGRAHGPWRLLARLGCDVCQGFFSARPMPREELMGWHDSWRERLPALLGE